MSTDAGPVGEGGALSGARHAPTTVASAAHPEAVLLAEKLLAAWPHLGASARDALRELLS